MRNIIRNHKLQANNQTNTFLIKIIKQTESHQQWNSHDPCQHDNSWPIRRENTLVTCKQIVTWYMTKQEKWENQTCCHLWSSKPKATYARDRFTDSDHVALLFSVSLQGSNTKPISVKSDQIYYKRYKWDPKEKDEYVNTFYEEESLAYREFLICGAATTYPVDELCEDCYRLLEYSVKRVSEKKGLH